MLPKSPFKIGDGDIQSEISKFLYIFYSSQERIDPRTEEEFDPADLRIRIPEHRHRRNPHRNREIGGEFCMFPFFVIFSWWNEILRLDIGEQCYSNSINEFIRFNK